MDCAIRFTNVSKIFKIPHMRTYDLKNYILHFRKMRTYEKFHALKNINLAIEKGEFIGIIGRNGSGKSTLLKLIAEILFPTTGGVNIKGSISPFLELGVGFNSELSGRENIFLYSSILGLSKREARIKYPKVLEFSELERFVDAPLKTYSSGMNVRLAFSVAIQSNAPILLVDEVLAVGDAPFQEKCFSIFDQFKKEKRTIVFVSHDMDAITKFCTKVFFLKNGEINAVGQPQEIVNRYLRDLN